MSKRKRLEYLVKHVLKWFVVVPYCYALNFNAQVQLRTTTCRYWPWKTIQVLIIISIMKAMPLNGAIINYHHLSSPLMFLSFILYKKTQRSKTLKIIMSIRSGSGSKVSACVLSLHVCLCPRACLPALFIVITVSWTTRPLSHNHHMNLIGEKVEENLPILSVHFRKTSSFLIYIPSLYRHHSPLGQ